MYREGDDKANKIVKTDGEMQTCKISSTFYLWIWCFSKRGAILLFMSSRVAEIKLYLKIMQNFNWHVKIQTDGFERDHGGQIEKKVVILQSLVTCLSKKNLKKLTSFLFQQNVMKKS